jgi:hypothetical protein
MNHRLRPLTWFTAFIAAGALALTTIPAASAGDAIVTRNLTFATTFTSVGTDLTTLPGDIVYGWNDLRGRTKWGKRSARVKFLGSVDYIDGSGPFGGFVTITRTDGTKLALQVAGEATSPPGPGTKDTTFSGPVQVIGGTGKFAGATGSGTMTGSRTAALGGAVQLVFTVHVQRPA